MLKMTAAEIVNTLKPMKDFAPAILRAGEIVAAVEEAERITAAKEAMDQELDRAIASKTDREAELVSSIRSLGKEQAGAKAAEREAREAADVQVRRLEDLNKQTAELEKKLAASDAELKLRGEFEAYVKFKTVHTAA